MRRKAKTAIAGLTLLVFLVLGVTLASATAPTVTIEPASEISFAGAEVSGEVDPADHETSYHFEYVSQANFEASEWAEASQAGPGSLPEGAGSTPVQAELTGLAPATVYHLRLRASNSEGEEAVAVAASFETDPVNPPLAMGLGVTAVTTDSAHFKGTVNSGGTGPGEASSWRFECSPECPTLEGEAEGSTESGADVEPEADAKGLEPHREYTLTLRVTDAAGLSAEASSSFETGTVATEAETLSLHGPIDATSARVLGQVNPHNSALSDCHFDYGTTTSYGESVPCDSDPSGNSAEIVGANLSGLSPTTTYHYRLVADNGVGGPVAGTDQIVTAAAPSPAPATCPNESVRQQQGSTYLPDCRGYELVSPVISNGALLSGAALGAGGHAAMSYIGSTPGSPSGSVARVSATRTAHGWSAQSMLPSGADLLGPTSLLAAATPDFSSTILLYSSSYVTSSVSPHRYLVRRFPDGSQVLLHTYGVAGQGFNFYVASADLSRVYNSTDEDPQGLGETPGTYNIYEYGSGSPILASRMPDGSVPKCGVPAVNFQSFPAALINRISTHLVSSDGDRVFFHSSGDNCEAAAPVDLYRRDIVEESTTLISGPPLSGEDHGATLLRANAAGTAAYFFTATRLSPEDLNTTNDVYRFTDQAGNVCLTCAVEVDIPDLTNPVSGQGLPQISEDGSHLYFQSAAKLAPGAGGSPTDLYVMKAGKIHFVGPSNGLVSRRSELTRDGNVLIFRSNRPGLNAITGSDNGGRSQFYRYQDDAESLVCVSCPRSGAPAAGEVELNRLSFGNSLMAFEDRRALSADGSTFAYLTTSPLVPRDVNGDWDIYRWHNGESRLITDGTSTYPLIPEQQIRLMDVSEDGSDILFADNVKLTTDPVPDHPLVQLYTAHVDGGFEHTLRPSCEADGCRPQPTTSLPGSSPATASFLGSDNVNHRHHRRHHRSRHHRKRPRSHQSAQRKTGGSQ